MHEAGVGETVDGNEAQGGAEYHQVLPARLAGEDSWVSLDRVGRKALRSGRTSALGIAIVMDRLRAERAPFGSSGTSWAHAGALRVTHKTVNTRPTRFRYAALATTRGSGSVSSAKSFGQKRDHSEEDLRVDSGVAMGLPSLSLTAMNAWASSEER